MSDPFPDKDESSNEPRGTSSYVRPPDWKLRADEWAKTAIPMPAWAKTFARTGKFPPPEDRVSNESGNTAVDDARMDSDKAYADKWRGTVREMTRLKAEATMVIIEQKKAGTPESLLARAAAQRGFDVDEEWYRLARDRDRGAPLILRAFPALTSAAVAGRALAAAERERARAPLFAPKVVDIDDIDGFPGSL